MPGLHADVDEHDGANQAGELASRNQQDEVSHQRHDDRHENRAFRPVAIRHPADDGRG